MGGVTAGLVLAAGTGRRYGMPKALIPYPDRLLVQRAADTLTEAGISRVVVVLGAEAERVRQAAPGLPPTVINPDWRTGLGSSLRVGLTSLGGTPISPDGSLASSDGAPVSPGGALAFPGGSPVSPGGSPASSDGSPAFPGGAMVDAVVVLLVDMPGVTAEAVRRVAAFASADALVMGGYGERRGHPVLLGREHWAGVIETATGDSGARAYLKTHAVRVVPVGDVADDLDLDVPELNPHA